MIWDQERLVVNSVSWDPSEYEGGELQINTGKVSVAEKEKGAIRRSLVLWIEGPAFV